MNIRRATSADLPIILTLIRDLAEYEKELDRVEATEESLAATMFSDNPRVFCELAEDEGETVGLAIWFFNYSTWQSKYGIYLEDLFVKPHARGRGHGLALLKHLAALCVENGGGRFAWSVLDWNQPAIDFYTQLGAVPLSEWVGYRVSGPALDALAAL